jgi:N-acetylmuramoyl-L-alanine amidase
VTRLRPGYALLLVMSMFLVVTVGVRAWTTLTIARPILVASAGKNTTASRQVLPSAATFRAGFTPNACLAFAPLRGNVHRTIFVDPGHGGLDPGGSGTTTQGAAILEKDVTLAVGLDVTTLLRDEGYTVILSRDTDALVSRTLAGDVNGGVLTAVAEHRDIVARVACANAAKAQALIAIHFDAFDDPTANGAETLYDRARPFAAANRRLAVLTQAAVLAHLRANGWAVPDRGVVDDSIAGTPALTTEGTAYGHLLELGPAASGWLAFPSTMPGILVEPLFLTHPAEADVASSAKGQQAIAAGLAQALDEFFTANARGAA